MKDSTTADAGHHEHESQAAGRPDTAGPRFHGVTDRGRLALPAAMVLSGIVSVQAGAGIASRLFHEIPPAAVTGLRLWTSAVAIAVVAGRRLARAFGDLAKREPGPSWPHLGRAGGCLPHLEDGTPIAITGAGRYFGGAGEVVVWNLHTGRMQQTPTAPYPVGALCCDSGRGVAIGTATEIVALQHERSGIHQGPHRRWAIRGSDNGPLSDLPARNQLRRADRSGDAGLPPGVAVPGHRVSGRPGRSGLLRAPQKPHNSATRRPVPTGIPRTKRHTPVHLLCVLKARRTAGQKRRCV